MGEVLNISLFSPVGEFLNKSSQFRPCARIKTAGIYRFADITGIDCVNLGEDRQAESKKNLKN